jgi:hypothetical protein
MWGASKDFEFIPKISQTAPLYPIIILNLRINHINLDKAFVKGVDKYGIVHSINIVDNFTDNRSLKLLLAMNKN